MRASEASTHESGLTRAELLRRGLAAGGHFAAWEEPRLFAEELRAAFRPLR
jgi:hypothetical protein